MRQVKTSALKKSLFAASLLAINSYVLAAGQLEMTPIRETVEGLEKKEIRLENKGDQTLYLEVSMSQIDDANLDPKQQKRTKINDIQSPEIVQNLNKLSLGPGQSRNLTLTALKAPLQEKVYVLYAVPVAGIKVEGEKEDKVRAPINITVGYGAIIYHKPAANKQVMSWEYQCQADEILLKSTGNVHSTFNLQNTSPEIKSSHQFNLFPGVGRKLAVKSMKGVADGKQFEIKCP